MAHRCDESKIDILPTPERVIRNRYLCLAMQVIEDTDHSRSIIQSELKDDVGAFLGHCKARGRCTDGPKEADRIGADRPSPEQRSVVAVFKTSRRPLNIRWGLELARQPSLY